MKREVKDETPIAAAGADRRDNSTQAPPKKGHWFFRWFGPLILSDLCVGLTLTDRKVLDALVRFARPDGRSWVSLRTLARYVSPSAPVDGEDPLRGARTRARTSIKKFLGRGVITRIERGVGPRGENAYHLWRGPGVASTPDAGAASSHDAPIRTSYEVDPSPSGTTEKKDAGGRNAPWTSSSTSFSQEMRAAVAAVHAIAPEFNDGALLRRYLHRFGLDALRSELSRAARRKPRSMKNRSGFVARWLGNEIDAAEAESEEVMDGTWGPAVLPPPGWTPRPASEDRRGPRPAVVRPACDSPYRAVRLAVERAYPSGLTAADDDVTERPVRAITSRPAEIDRPLDADGDRDHRNEFLWGGGHDEPFVDDGDESDGEEPDEPDEGD